jgi:glycosyltransferase involved in cell wall biosynthesis
MRITLYGRTDRGGLKTHVLTLAKELSKRHVVNIVSQDTLHSTSVYGGLYWIDLKRTKGIIQDSLKNSDVFHIHHPATSSELFPSKFVSKTPIVDTFHYSLGNNFVSRKASLLNQTNIFLVNNIARKYARRSFRYIAVGSKLFDILSKYNLTSLINNGVDTNVYKPRKEARYFDEFTVGYIGRLDPEKNVENLIKACKCLDVPVVLAGPSRDLPYLKRTYEGKRVLFLGEIKALPFYSRIDVMVSPSMMEANIPLTVLEAMSCGTPVITGNCGGEESHVNESFSLLTGPAMESIRDSIMRIRKMDYNKMGRNARKEAIKSFNLRDKVRQIEKLYLDAVKNS